MYRNFRESLIFRGAEKLKMRESISVLVRWDRITFGFPGGLIKDKEVKGLNGEEVRTQRRTWHPSISQSFYCWRFRDVTNVNQIIYLLCICLLKKFL